MEWPPKYDLFGVQITATTYDEAEEAIFQAVGQQVPAVVSLHAVHAVMTAAGDPSLRAKVNTFQIVAPDGQPVRWALNLLYHTGLRDRVYGPELTLRLCRRAAETGIPVYLYGGSPATVETLRKNLVAKYPGLQIAGFESPPFRPLTAEEDEAVVWRINQSGAGIVLIGLGCPKQDHFAYEHRERIAAVQVCVGAAFDFHAGTKRMAPRWLQRHGLEWLYRLSQEPGRLWRRYLVTNSLFVARLLVALLRLRPHPTPRPRRQPIQFPETRSVPLCCGSNDFEASPGRFPQEGPLPKRRIMVRRRSATMQDDLILVAGAGGFIGGHLIADLRRRGYTNLRAVDIKPLDEWFQIFSDVENVTADLKDRDNCYWACQGVCEVYNLAADMGGMGFIENHKALCMLSVLINTHLLLAAHDQGVKRFFYASSACVYNADKQREAEVTPLKEEDAYPAMAEDGYGWEKLFSERMCRHFREDFGLLTRAARFHNVYGPNGTWEGGREKAPAAICRKVIHAKMTGNHAIEIWGDGSQTRSFMYISDCLQGIDQIMHSRIEEPVNLGSSELVTINQLVDLAEEIAGIKLARTYNLDAPKGVMGRNSDNTKIRQYLDWEPSVRLRDGLERTYAWIYDQYREQKQDAVPADAAWHADREEGSSHPYPHHPR